MSTETIRLNSWQISSLLRGEPEEINGWIERWEVWRAGFCFAVIFAGAGLFGFAMGWWRSPVQAGYTALKLPLIILRLAGRQPSPGQPAFLDPAPVHRVARAAG